MFEFRRREGPARSLSRHTAEKSNTTVAGNTGSCGCATVFGTEKRGGIGSPEAVFCHPWRDRAGLLLHGPERGLRPGTLPVALIVALGLATDIARRDHARRRQSCQTIREQALQALAPLNPRLTGDQSQVMALPGSGFRQSLPE